MDSQPSLFDRDEFLPWREQWKQMPEFIQEDLMPWKSLLVHFRSGDDMREFGALVGQKVLETTKSIWFPEAEIVCQMNKRYTDEP